MESLHIVNPVRTRFLSEIENNLVSIAQVDDEIEGLMRKVRQLQFIKLQHQHKIRHCQGMITLARHLPLELLARIFEMCARDGYTLTPLAASHVCTEWRKAATVPAVWSHLYVDLDSRDPYGRTQFWLERAGESLLYITIEVRADTSRLPRVMDALLRRLSRWRSFRVHSVFLNHVNWIFSLCNRPGPELRTIDLSVLHEIDHDAIVPTPGHHFPGLINAFPQSPQFYTFRVTRNAIPSLNSIPSQTRELSICLSSDRLGRMSSIDEVKQVLQALPMLEKLSLSLEYGHDRSFLPATNTDRLVELTVLKTLALRGSPSMFGILSCLQTPRLESIHLRSSLDPLGYPDEEVSSFVRGFLERSEVPLRKLELHDIDFSVSEFAACLSAVPALEELCLHESDIPDEILLQFSTNGGLSPGLTNLDLRWCGQVTGDALVRLVRDKQMNAGRATNRKGQVIQPIALITVINCCSVHEQNILDLADITDCRIVSQIDDYCHPFGCCQNERYRRRLHLRHQHAAAGVKKSRRNLIM